MQFVFEPKALTTYSKDQRYVLVLPLGVIFGEKSLLKLPVYYVNSVPIEEWENAQGPVKELTHETFYVNALKRNPPKGLPVPLFQHAMAQQVGKMHIYIVYYYKTVIGNLMQTYIATVAYRNLIDSMDEWQENSVEHNYYSGILSSDDMDSDVVMKDDPESGTTIMSTLTSSGAKFHIVKYPLVDLLYHNFVGVYEMWIIRRDIIEGISGTDSTRELKKARKSQVRALRCARFSQINKFDLCLRVPIAQVKLVTDYIRNTVVPHVEINHGILYSIVHVIYEGGEFAAERLRERELEWFWKQMRNGLSYSVDINRVAYETTQQQILKNYGGMNNQVSNVMSTLMAFGSVAHVFDNEYFWRNRELGDASFENYLSGNSHSENLCIVENWLQFLGLSVEVSDYHVVNVTLRGVTGEGDYVETESETEKGKVDFEEKKKAFEDMLYVQKEKWRTVDYMFVYQLFLTQKMIHLGDIDRFPYLVKDESVLHLGSRKDYLKHLTEASKDVEERRLEQLEREAKLYKQFHKVFKLVRNLEAELGDDFEFLDKLNGNLYEGLMHLLGALGGLEYIQSNMSQSSDVEMVAPPPIRSSVVDRVRTYWKTNIFFDVRNALAPFVFLNKAEATLDTWSKFSAAVKLYTTTFTQSGQGVNQHQDSFNLLYKEDVDTMVKSPSAYHLFEEIDGIENNFNQLIGNILGNDNRSLDLTKFLHNQDNNKNPSWYDFDEEHYEKLIRKAFSTEYPQTQKWAKELLDPKTRENVIEFLDQNLFFGVAANQTEEKWYKIVNIKDQIDYVLDEIHEEAYGVTPIEEMQSERNFLLEDDELMQLTAPTFFEDYLKSENIQSHERLMGLLSTVVSKSLGTVHERAYDLYHRLWELYWVGYYRDPLKKVLGYPFEELSSAMHQLFKLWSLVDTADLRGFHELEDLELSLVERRSDLHQKILEFEKQDASLLAMRKKFITELKKVVTNQFPVKEVFNKNTPKEIQALLEVRLYKTWRTYTRILGENKRRWVESGKPVENYDSDTIMMEFRKKINYPSFYFEVEKVLRWMPLSVKMKIKIVNSLFKNKPYYTARLRVWTNGNQITLFKTFQRIK